MTPTGPRPRTSPSVCRVSSPFPDFATTTLASWLDRQPVEATLLGAHDYDARLDDPSPEAAAARAARVREQLTELDGVATVGVSVHREHGCGRRQRAVVGSVASVRR